MSDVTFSCYCNVCVSECLLLVKSHFCGCYEYLLVAAASAAICVHESRLHVAVAVIIVTIADLFLDHLSQNARVNVCVEQSRRKIK